MFTPVATQTLDALRKTKEAQTAPKTTSSSDCQVRATLVGHQLHHTLSLLPTVDRNTVRSFYYARTTVRSQEASTTVSDNIQLTSLSDLSLDGVLN
jgi:hypothetical protein